jgi:hypothetical protein
MHILLRAQALAAFSEAHEQSIEDCKRALQDKRYKICKRMPSGSDFPPPLKAVCIAQKHGGDLLLQLASIYVPFRRRLCHPAALRAEVGGGIVAAG